MKENKKNSKNIASKWKNLKHSYPSLKSPPASSCSALLPAQSAWHSSSTRELLPEIFSSKIFILCYRQRVPDGQFHPIFFKRFDPPNVLWFVIQIRSALLNLMGLGPGTRQVGLISGYISTHQLHASHFQLMMLTTKLIKKLWNLPKCLGGKGSHTQKNGIMSL